MNAVVASGGNGNMGEKITMKWCKTKMNYRNAFSARSNKRLSKKDKVQTIGLEIYSEDDRKSFLNMKVLKNLD
ncbi:Hypothetical predicted protein [Octopus vulgaris]|uniref:Uncharacterized protein n=1 Tax=Octopus vulgaris TaxID=6645 RepID=A0AA36BGI7_OCTVU|nr:Hypothetical predicted protein [Octopus vulgaris]